MANTLINVGIICDLSFNKHIAFKNYYYALKNIFPNIKIVNSIYDLKNINLLFIGNEHFLNHKNVWNNVLFQKYCNSYNIKVVVFSTEKIYNSFFAHNEQIQKDLENFDYLYQYVIDIEDSKLMKCNIFHSFISKEFYNIEKSNIKLNKCAFLGSMNAYSYDERTKIINEVQKNIEIEFPKYCNTWQEYLKELSNYRFILCPLGNGKGLNLKFYETLLVNSIPIQQITEDMLEYYSLEASFDDCIFFKHTEEISEKIKNCKYEKSYNNITLEKHIIDLLNKEGIL